VIPKEVYHETLLGFLAPVRRYLDDPSVTEIMINGPTEVYIERKGRLERAPVSFGSRDAVMCALRNAAQFVGKHLNEENPILEARLPDGSRLEAIIPPAAPDGPCVAIRRFSQSTLTLPLLVELGSLTTDAVATLDALVKAKLNVMVAGGTGSGKTSLLNLLSGFAYESERIAVIEDSKEVELQRPHVFYLEARPPDLEGRGAVSIRDLFRATLRMRPDRIVIGEIRGGEALDIIQAMVSGHGGCMGTLHATYPRDTLTRLETMAMMSEIQMPLTALRLQIASGVNVIVQVSRSREGERHVTHITEVCGFDVDRNGYELADIFVRDYHVRPQAGQRASTLRPTGILPRFLPRLHEQGLDLPAAVYEAAARKANPHGAS
jgi:pilus assembly protein CpaF